KDAKQGGAPARFATACHALGSIQLFDSGDTAAALGPLERGLEFCRSFEVLLILPWLAAATGLAQARCGRLAEGIALGGGGVARGYQERGYEADGLWLWGEIAWRGDPLDLDAAEADYRGARGIADALEMRPLAARCHLSLGLLHRQTGRADEAREHFTTAT